MVPYVPLDTSILVKIPKIPLLLKFEEILYLLTFSVAVILNDPNFIPFVDRENKKVSALHILNVNRKKNVEIRKVLNKNLWKNKIIIFNNFLLFL